MMKGKLIRLIEDLEIVVTIAFYAAICGAAWEFGKHLYGWIFR